MHLSGDDRLKNKLIDVHDESQRQCVQKEVCVLCGDHQPKSTTNHERHSDDQLHGADSDDPDDAPCGNLRDGEALINPEDLFHVHAGGRG